MYTIGQLTIVSCYFGSEMWLAMVPSPALRTAKCVLVLMMNITVLVGKLSTWHAVSSLTVLQYYINSTTVYTTCSNCNTLTILYSNYFFTYNYRVFPGTIHWNNHWNLCRYGWLYNFFLQSVSLNNYRKSHQLKLLLLMLKFFSFHSTQKRYSTFYTWCTWWHQHCHCVWSNYNLILSNFICYHYHILAGSMLHQAEAKSWCYNNWTYRQVR